MKAYTKTITAERAQQLCESAGKDLPQDGFGQVIAERTPDLDPIHPFIDWLELQVRRDDERREKFFLCSFDCPPKDWPEHFGITA